MTQQAQTPFATWLDDAFPMDGASRPLLNATSVRDLMSIAFTAGAEWSVTGQSPAPMDDPMPIASGLIDKLANAWAHSSTLACINARKDLEQFLRCAFEQVRLDTLLAMQCAPIPAATVIEDGALDVEWTDPAVDRTPFTATGYESLASVLISAYDQAARGNGKGHHAQGQPFDRQPMQDLIRLHGVGFATGQASKKASEALRLPTTDRSVAELLGAINYLAGAVIAMERDPKG